MIRGSAQVSPGEALECDVAVVGAGPLGIPLALELAAAGHRVVLAESGGVEVGERAQQLSSEPAGEEDPLHAPKAVAVRRAVGGTSALWGGRCVPFDPVDFDTRPLVEGHVWPIEHTELMAYMARACAWCGCGEPIFNAKQVPELAGRDMVPGLKDADVRTTDLERWSLPARFGKLYREELESQATLDLITELTCTAIHCTEDGSEVAWLEMKRPDGTVVELRAKHYVLATGGLEATRLLLASNSVHADGIGNHSGHLGRWYMAHVEARVAMLHLNTDPDQTIYEHERDRDGVYVRRRFTITRERQIADGIPNAAVWIVNPEMGDASHGSGILSGVYLTLKSPLGKYMLAEAIRQAGLKTKHPSPITDHIRNILRDIGPSLKFAFTFSFARFLKPGRKAPGFFVGSAANVYPVHYHGEHLPHRESVVELSDQRDELGVPRLRTRMHFSDADVSGVRQYMERIDARLRETGVGELEYLEDDIEGMVREYLKGNAGYHQTGTTRMSATPEGGVVDSDLTVHGVSNLHIASTSVFPTSGQANPTLSGVALSVRLADRLRALLAA